MDRLALEVAYQEILKTELCIIRHGHYCVDFDNETYVSIHPVTIHDFSERLSAMDLLYSLVKAYQRFGGSSLDSYVKQVLETLGRSGDLEELMKALVEEGLIYEDDCEELSHVMRVQTVNKIRSLSREFNSLVRYNYAWDEIRRLPGGEKLLKFEDKFRGKCFMTYHGYLMRVMRELGPYPGEGRVMEAYVLPFIEEGITEYNVPLKDLAPVMTKFVGELSGVDSTKIVDAVLRASQAFIKGGMLSKYQVEMLRSFLSKHDPMIGVISAPTSAGKTTIFFLYTVLKLLAFKAKKDKRKAMLIYPRKTLAREQLQRLVNFLMELNPLLETMGISPMTLAIYDGDSPSTTKSLGRQTTPTFRGLKCPDGSPMVYQDGKPACGDRTLDWLTEVKDQGYQNDIILTNHSQIATNLFRSHDERVNLFDNLSIIVVDEAHTFADPENSTHFFYTILEILLYLTEREKGLPLERPFEDVKETIGKLNLDLIFSSATLWGTELDKNLDLRGVGGFKGIGRAGSGQGIPKPVDDFLDAVLHNLKKLYDRKEFLDFYTVVGSSEKRQRKIIVPMLIFPAPEYSASFPFTLASLYTIFFSDSTFRRMQRAFPKGVNSIMFVDNKIVQRVIAEELLERILEANRYHEDISLISPIRYGTPQETMGSKLIAEELNRTNSILDKTFTTYSILNLYYTKDQLKAISSPWDWIDAVKSGKLPRLRDGKTLLDVLQDMDKGLSGKDELQLMGERSLFYMVYHNADLKKEERIKREEVLSSNKWRTVLSTSTLELGIDLPNVGIILQYGAPSTSDSIIQRFGRGGRNDDVLRVSLGILVARSHSHDVSLFDEYYATRRLFFPITLRPKPLKTRDEVVKAYSYVALVGYLSRNLGKDIEETVDYISSSEDFRQRAREFLNSMLPLLVNDPSRLAEDIIEDLKQIARIYTYSRNTTIEVEQGNLVTADVDNIRELMHRIINEIEVRCKGKVDDLCRNGLIPLQGTLEVAEMDERLNLTMLVTSSSRILNAFYMVNSRKGDKELQNLKIDLRSLAGFFYPHSYFSKKAKRNFLHFLTYWVKPEVPHPSIKSMESISFTITGDGLEESSVSRPDLLLKDIPMRRSR